MFDNFYEKNLMRHAATAQRAGRLQDSDASVTLDNPLCGDRVIIDIKLNDSQIIDLAQHTRACVLCQASASIIGSHAIGAREGEITLIMAELTAMLKDNGQPPDGDWKDLSVFKPVIDNKGRHNCVLLPFEALEQAFKQIAEKSKK